MDMESKDNYLRSSWSTFKFALRPYKWRFALMMVLIVLGSACAYSLPYFMKLIVDKVSQSSGGLTPHDFLGPLSLLALALLLQEVFFRAGHIIEVYAASGAFQNITNSLYSGLIKRPTSYFENKFSGDLGRRIEQVGSAVIFFVEQGPWEWCWIIMTIVMSGIMLSLTHVYVFATFVIWLVLFVATTIPLVRWHYRVSEKLATSHAHLSGSIVDTLSNIPLVQSFGGGPFEEAYGGGVVKGVMGIERKVRWITVLNKFQCGVSIMVLGVSLAYVSIILFVRNEFTVGDFVIVASAIPAIVGVVWSFGEVIAHTSKRLSELSDAVAHLRENQEQLMGGDVSEHATQEYSVEFNDVHFQYPSTATAVFDKFSLLINQGEKIGIVGASGVGKSTLVKLLLRQHDSEGGEVLIGGVRIQDFSLKAFHQLISYVPQDTSLFHRTLFENIRYARLNATREEVLQASKRAKADEFISTFPEGYETKVGERGVKLSGGQRQRIALARAILKDAPILILDEATSSLDSQSESSIQTALSELFEGHTVIAIAHRLSTLRAMDRIVVLDKGLVVESGSPQELLAKEDSIFKKMWEHQKDGFVT